jgi:PDZ domain-containing protein
VSRRTLTVAAAAMLAAALGVLGVTLPVPMVALGPGPTYDTLGEVDGTPVVAVDGLPTYETSGQLNMTTVSVTDQLTMFAVLGLWASGERRVVPRDAVFPPGRTSEEIQQENTQQFVASEASAEAAALAELGIPTKVVVTELVPDSPATGLLEVGDEIVAVSGRTVDTPLAVSEALSDTTPGQEVTITYRRSGAEQQADVVLGASQDRTQGLLGVRPGVEPLEGDITISLGGIGGPSAGLMFALALVDKLTPEELTGGRFVAGTGAILPDGQVTRIDGVSFKMQAAHDAGATVFLVPAANCTDAVSGAPEGMLLVRVDALDDAVSSLEALQSGGEPPAC